MSERHQPARRPGPINGSAGSGERAPPAGFGGAQDEDPVGLRRSPGLAAPELRHLAVRGDVVQDDSGKPVALRCGSGLPDAFGESDGPGDGPAAVELDVTDDEDDDRIVGQDRAQAGEDVTKEYEVRLSMVGVVERRVDLLRVEAKEPGS